MNSLSINTMSEFSNKELISINGGSMLGTIGGVCMGAGAAIFGVGIALAGTGVGIGAGAGACFVGGVIFGVGAACCIIDSL